MSRRLSRIGAVLLLVGCAASPDPAVDGEQPAVVAGFGAMGRWPGVWKLQPALDSDAAATAATLRVFPVLASSFLEATLVYRVAGDPVPRLARQFWSFDPATDGYSIWNFADGGAHYHGVLRATDTKGELRGPVEGQTADGGPLQGELAITSTARRMTFELQLETPDGPVTSRGEFTR